MKSCPLCLGDVPAQARKCQHCGEWLHARQRAFQWSSDEPCNVVMYRQMMFSVFKLGSAVVAAAVIGAVVVLICTYTCWCA